MTADGRPIESGNVKMGAVTMWEHRFDLLARALSGGVTRRGLGAGTLGAVGLAPPTTRSAPITPTGVNPGGKPPGSRCRLGVDCETLICRRGKCRCPCGLIACDGTCHDPETDPAACGRCGNVCADPFGACVAGVCHPTSICTEPVPEVVCPPSECICGTDIEGTRRCFLNVFRQVFVCRSNHDCYLAYGRGNVCDSGLETCVPLCPDLDR